MDSLLFATIGGAICGAFVVGVLILGYLWWSNQQRIQRLQTNLNRGDGPAPDLPPPRYFSNPNDLAPRGSDAQTQAPPSSPPAGVAPGMAWLDGVGGIVAGQRLMVAKEEVLMGRSGVCDMQFHDPKVSRQHALLRLYNNEYFIQDMQSSRGTYINGRRVETHRLQDRDQIQMGDTVLIFRRY